MAKNRGAGVESQGIGGKAKKKRRSADRPARTRSHYIADLSLNHVERFVLRRGHTVEGPRHDYGYDLVLSTYDYKGSPTYEIGEIENGCVYLQLKATDNLTVLQDGHTISFEMKRQHVEHWIGEAMPVVLVVYDVASETAYWLYVQRYLKDPGFTMPPGDQQGVTLHLSKANVLNEAAIDEFRGYKETVLNEVKAKCNLHV
jgi:hypothetical protein